MLRAFAVATLAALAVGLLTAVLTPPCLLAGIFDLSGRAANGVIRCWARLLLRVGAIRVRTLGSDGGNPRHRGEVLPFKRGSFLLAIQAGAPVIPVSLVGVKQRIPRGLGSLTRGPVTIRIHDPIATRGRDPETAAQLAESVREIVIRGLNEA